MKNQKMFFFAWALALTAGLTGCGNTPAAVSSEPAAETTLAVETTVPEETVSPDTLLAMELVENYINMENPQHESIQTRFGLVTAKKKRPISWYEDYSYLETGEAVLVQQGYNVAAADSDSFDDEQFNSFYDRPEDAQWLGEFAPSDAWFTWQTYYLTAPTGEVGKHDYIYYDISQDAPISHGFSSLPKKEYTVFLRDAVSNAEKAETVFTLSEEEINDMEAKQGLMLKVWAGEKSGDYVTADAVPDHFLRSCYVVTYDVPMEYLNPYNSKLINEIFSHIPNAYSMGADTSFYDSLPQETAYEMRHPITARLQNGPIHVTLYFDKDSKACIGEKLDLTDCSQDLMAQLCRLELVEPGDRSFIIEKQYFDNRFDQLPGFIQHQDSAEQKKNQAVFWKPCAPGYARSTHHQIFSTQNYGLQLNDKTELYEITDGKDVIGILQGYDNFDFKWKPDEYLDTETMVSSSEVLTSKNGLTYTIHEVPMGSLFGEQDFEPSEIGYMVTCYEEGLDTERGVLISTWNRETAVSIMDDLTLTTEEMPRFFK